MAKIKFTEPVTVATLAIGLPGNPYQLPKGSMLEVTDEQAAAVLKVYEGRCELMQDKPEKSGKSKE